MISGLMKQKTFCSVPVHLTESSLFVLAYVDQLLWSSSVWVTLKGNLSQVYCQAHKYWATNTILIFLAVLTCRLSALI